MFTSLRARLTPRLARTLAFVGAAGLALGTAACTTDGPTALSEQTASFAKAAGGNGGLATEVTTLAWTKPAKERTASAVIGRAGGVLRIPSGARLVVPAGAVSANVTFRVTQVAGSILAYDFEPHGITFAVPLTLEQPINGTNFDRFTNPVVRGAYFKDVLQLDQTRLKATVDEFRPTVLSIDKKWIRFSIDHFSGYIVAMD
ncbi:MAG: hypothetical protein ACK6DR_14185 [Gemmatimonas sp.]|jgi:hypothetical protein|uniref:hypothetical protein n=1 Tax=Gemmatimonas sp. TaxID=1962908 RepID=UPI0022C95101|nr:hypothetical protein [Gemmatimonas sp.]MCA2985709.1 hypothetical protein [Gemmatimonas sp.]MCA2987630.1 hypothetical protein [Gemmatimonas sp.]MCA2994646.1 hypothetical protein [Gemmatimonas sp.]MCE2955473.1 hypothetical protein [Gemmatimonas sp.]MCZ8013939.1 hypothetical protein [Gemmatimonas sp.]